MDLLLFSHLDRHFVPNITFGHPVVESLRKQLGQQAFFGKLLFFINFRLILGLEWVTFELSSSYFSMVLSCGIVHKLWKKMPPEGV